MKTNDEEDFLNRRSPCLIVYLDPFQMVEVDGKERWATTIEECNNTSWDYVKLHEIIGVLDIGLEHSDQSYPMVIGRDGALALPPLPEFINDQDAVNSYNRYLAAFLLGGVYCQAVSLDNLEFGSILDSTYIRSHTFSKVSPNEFHSLARRVSAPPATAIRLLDPRTIALTELQKAISIGLKVFNQIPNLNGEFLLKATTGIARRDWASGLANLWIVVEQLIEYLWDREVVSTSKDDKLVFGRSKQLKDNRTWTLAARLEMLYQKELFNSETLNHLSIGRRARNNLSHRGSYPTEVEINHCYSGALDLFRATMPDVELPIYSLDLKEHAITDPFLPKEPSKIQPRYWMEIRKLPGEHEIEIEEAKQRKRKFENNIDET